MKKRGILIFTTHDGDEVDATFIEESEEMNGFVTTPGAKAAGLL